MSFSTLAWSPEVTHAINVATSQGVICVSSAGNFGQEFVVYPAGAAQRRGRRIDQHRRAGGAELVQQLR